jgi:hypothetical protein
MSKRAMPRLLPFAFAFLLGLAVAGCEEYKFQPVGGPAFMESSPVQAGVQLFHDANGDVCRAQLTETVRFDLAPMKKQYREQYGRGAGGMLLRLALDEEQRLLVRYAFEA